MTENKHLTPDQRIAIRKLFDECDMVELLHAVAGIVRHDVADFAAADDAANLIVKAIRRIEA